MPRKSSTNARALSTRISHLKAEMNPIPRAGRASQTPKPMRSSGRVYTQRKVRVVKTIPATGDQVVITVGDVIKALGVSSTEQISIQLDRVTAWNTTNSSLSSNYISVLLGNPLFSSGSTGNQVAALVGPYEDYGGGGKNPSLTIDIPRVLSCVFDTTSATTVNAMTINASPFGSGFAVPGIQFIVVDIILNVGW